MMYDDKKYILGDSVGIIFGLTEFPETVLNPEDDYMISNGIGIGMRVHMNDVETDPIVVMDPRQAKELLKGLKKMMREYRRKNRRFIF